MRILIFHGYLLSGTGSNVYNAELARALAESGHEVHLLCQDRKPEALEFVDAVGDWVTGELQVQSLDSLQRERGAGYGRLTVYRPPIGDVLPVYVADRYEGFTAKTFPELTDEELDFYIAANVAAVRDVHALVDVQCAMANHMVMGPCILARALPREVPYAVKIHGSAMEYTVRPYPRFLPYAIEGITPAATVLVGSRHIAERAWDTFQIEGLEKRIFLGPPGVDIENFKPQDQAKARAGLNEIATKVEQLPRNGYSPVAAAATTAVYERLKASHGLNYDEVSQAVSILHNGYDTAGIDAEAPAALRALGKAGDAPVVLYVGKLIVSKGVDLLISAWPLVLQKFPNARLAIIGFGAYREGLEMLLAAYSSGDLETARSIIVGGRAFESGPTDVLTFNLNFIDTMTEDEREAYVAAAIGMDQHVHWFGRLEHDLLSNLIPAADVQIVPSTFPEAFGMVAAEAAACGVPSISADHSGLAEVARVLEQNVSGRTGALLSFPTNYDSVELLSNRITGLLGLGGEEHDELHARLSITAKKHFSWTGVARDLVAAATGAHDTLRRP